MIRVGIIGFGFMGRTHLEAFRSVEGCEVVAVADSKDGAFSAHATGNLPDQKGDGPDALAEEIARYTSVDALLGDASVDAVVICVPTPDHPSVAVRAIESGHHVLVEKPLAVTADEAVPIAAAASAHPDRVCMPAMCMRFWPGWAELYEAVHDRRYGDVRAATFVRLGATPGWAADFYQDPDRSGGAILDLHIHDADFVRACFGEPQRIRSAGDLNHVVTTYDFGDGRAIVAEGGWVPAQDFPFTMRYRVQFDAGVMLFDLSNQPAAVMHHREGGSTVIADGTGSGYAPQAKAFVDAIASGTPAPVTIDDGIAAIRLVEAERRDATSS